MILNWGSVLPSRHSAHSEGIFSCPNSGDTTGIQWAEFRDAAKYLTMHNVIQSLHSTKNYLDQNTNSSEAENLG